ncbi:carbonic anhydrase [Xylaria sp. FL1042]|nr:carbonic anhydrase [Xylaria sp. FL1042]KAI0435417.1 carbonic anhydrase [Xylaria sp. FL1042]
MASLAQELLKRNEVYLEKGHKPVPLFTQIGFTPKKMIFSCFDSRVKPQELLGITDEDDAVIVRTASGTPARNLNDIAAIDNLTELTELIVIKHTDCGATYMTDNQIRAHIRKHNADIDGQVLDDFTVGTTHDIVERTRQDVELIKNSPIIRKELRETTTGLLFDITTGKLTKIV